MYIIDGSIKICLRHVVRVETNDGDKSIVFEMVSGKCAVKKFETQAEADVELISVEALIDGA
jgi:hypothetical protein